MALLSNKTIGTPGHIRLVSAHPSQNFDQRKADCIDMIVVHYTACNFPVSLRALTQPNPHGSVSAHYLIDEQGEILHLVDDQHRAWHAGASMWAGRESLNHCSLGIELVNDGFTPFEAPQIESLLILLQHLKQTYGIQANRILGHQDISANRKIDPGPYFPWGRVYDAEIATWPGKRVGIKTTLDTVNALTRENIQRKCTTFLSQVPDQSIISAALQGQGYAIERYGLTHCLMAYMTRYAECEAHFDAACSALTS